MKAIYINLDPYIAAFVAWLKANPVDPDTGGRATPPPTFDPLPLAVTIPLGEGVAIFKAAETDSGDWTYSWSTVDSVQIGVGATSSSDPLPGESGVIASDVVPALSTITPAAKYGVFAVAGDTTVNVNFNDGEQDFAAITFTIFVRREQAQGPVDLVDFTPPSAAPTPSAADIKSALVAAGPGALAGVSIKDTKWGDVPLTVAPADSGDINTLVGYLAASV